MTIMFVVGPTSRVLLTILVAASLLLVGCGARSVARQQYSIDANCPEDRITVERMSGERYVTSGCDGYAMYHCSGTVCTVKSSSETEAPKVVVVIPVSADQNDDSKPKVEKSKSGKTAVVADIILEKGSALRLSALAGEQAGSVRLRLGRVEREFEIAECELELMLNGQKVKTGLTKRIRQGAASGLSVDLSRMLVGELGTASQMAMRACEKRYNLSPEQLGKVRDFVATYQRELAWNGDAKSGKLGGLLAPASGWPACKVSSKMPPAKTLGGELRGDELYRLLSPSVLEVQAGAGEEMSQGSAVAVSPTEVLTNCHVVSGAQKIVLRSGKREWSAQLLRAEPATDRCVLTLKGAKLTPVRGVRAYTELKVGEPLYTLGSPNGLELSLSDGILSGLREDDGQHFVQTTAPISPGSSGGGLFDSRGNLVGITTMILVGRGRVNQSLNFAISADSFWDDNP